MNRKRLAFQNQHQILDFILKMEKEPQEYVLEDLRGWLRVNAHSVNGVLYAARDFKDIYIMNTEVHGKFPDFIEEYVDGN